MEGHADLAKHRAKLTAHHSAKAAALARDARREAPRARRGTRTIRDW